MKWKVGEAAKGRHKKRMVIQSLESSSEQLV